MTGVYLVLLACATAALIGLARLFFRRAPVPREATWEDVKAEAEHGGYRLITTEELAERYRRDSSSLLLVDTREDWEYGAGHIKGAVNFPLAPTWRARWRSRGALASLLGPDKERFVIFY